MTSQTKYILCCLSIQGDEVYITFNLKIASFSYYIPANYVKSILLLLSLVTLSVFTSTRYLSVKGHAQDFENYTAQKKLG